MRILIIEDDKTLNDQLRHAMENAGFVVDSAFDGEEGYFLGDVETYDAVILDLGLPNMDGISVLRNWRSSGNKVPVVILTARNNWNEKVAGLDAGADDYLAKPFEMEELIARLRAVIRRSVGVTTSTIICGSIHLDTRSNKVTVDNHPITLTAQEYRTLSYLLHHLGKTVSRTELIEHIYGQGYDRDSNTIEVFIGRLRRKLPAKTIDTIRGLGYRIDEPC